MDAASTSQSRLMVNTLLYFVGMVSPYLKNWKNFRMYQVLTAQVVQPCSIHTPTILIEAAKTFLDPYQENHILQKIILRSATVLLFD
jgi:hypothetical protein